MVNNNSEAKTKGDHMNIEEYDNALYSAQRLHCEELIDIMHYTEDDLLAKKIELFISSFVGEDNLAEIEQKRQNVIQYVANAISKEELMKYDYSYIFEN
jgi:hypothetical protein